MQCEIIQKTQVTTYSTLTLKKAALGVRDTRTTMEVFINNYDLHLCFTFFFFCKLLHLKHVTVRSEFLTKSLIKQTFNLFYFISLGYRMSSAVSVISGCSLDEDSRLQNSSMTFRETCTISRCAEGADSRVPSSFWEGAPSTHTNKCPSGRLQVTGNHPAGAGSLRDASRKAALIPVRTDPALALRRPSAATIKEPKSLPFNVQQRRPKGKEQHKPTLLLGLSSFPLVLLAPLYTYPSAHQAVVERQSNEAESCLLDEVGIQDTYLMRFSWDTGCH